MGRAEASLCGTSEVVDHFWYLCQSQWGVPGGEGAGSVSSLNNLFVAILWSRFGSGEKKQAEQKPNAVVEVVREGGPMRRWPWRWVGGGA